MRNLRDSDVVAEPTRAKPYDNEVYYRAVRIIGRLEILSQIASTVEPMSFDAGTNRLLGSIKLAISLAIESATDYATQYAPPAGLVEK